MLEKLLGFGQNAREIIPKFHLSLLMMVMMMTIIFMTVKTIADVIKAG